MENKVQSIMLKRACMYDLNGSRKLGSYQPTELLTFIQGVIRIFVLDIDLSRRLTDPVLAVFAEVPDVEPRLVVPVTRRDAPAALKRNLPDANNAREEIPDRLPIPDVPHLQRAIRAREYLELVVLEAGDRARVPGQAVPQLARLRIPDAQGRIGSGGDQRRGREAEETNEGRVTDERMLALPIVEVPYPNRAIHRARARLVPRGVVDHAVHCSHGLSEGPVNTNRDEPFWV
jgi:hypothetical protein